MSVSPTTLKRWDRTAATSGELEAHSTDNSGRMHLLLLSVTYNGMSGPDRDWASLANAIPADVAKITWIGREGTVALRPYLNPAVVPRLLDIPFPDFNYLVNMNAQLRRSRWLWTKIIIDHLGRLAKPLLQLHKAMADDPPDLVVSNTTAVTIRRRLCDTLREAACLVHQRMPGLPAAKLPKASHINSTPQFHGCGSFSSRCKVVPATGATIP